jgi:hypothetical protein
MTMLAIDDRAFRNPQLVIPGPAEGRTPETILLGGD